MNQFLYDVAEEAWKTYDLAGKIESELLYAWLLAEVHFASEQDVKLYTTLEYLPDTTEVKTLWYAFAMGYREFRHSLRRKVVATGNEVARAEPLKT